jgi:kojibiose phosphorylase
MTSVATSNPEDFVRLAKPFKVIAFDWDGTAVMGRKEDASEVNALLDRLLAEGVLVVVITGTNLTNTANQLAQVISGENNRGLFIATNRGSEIYGFAGGTEPIPIWRRKATPEEELRLTRSADEVREELAQRGIESRVIYDRLNRRKIDIIPLPEWADPPKWAIGELLAAVLARLEGAGIAGLEEVLELAEGIARSNGLLDPRVTSDVKHVEIGLTDKSDSVAWMCRELARERGIVADEMLIAGDEFGPIGGVEGSDHKMVTEDSSGAVFVSVGPEPGGAPFPVIHLGGGPNRFKRLLEAQLDLRKRRRAERPHARVELPAVRTADPAWLLVREGVEPARERENESLTAIANGYAGTRGSLAEGSTAPSAPSTFLAGVYDRLRKPRAVPELAVAPDWTALRILVAGHEVHLEAGAQVGHRRTLDMRQGMTWREWRHKDPQGRLTLLRGFRFASLDQRHLLFQTLTLRAENYSAWMVLEAIIEPPKPVVAGIKVSRPQLVPAEVEELELDDEVLRYQTLGGEIRVAIAAKSRLEGPEGELELTSTERAEGRLIKRWEIPIAIGETYRLDRLVGIVTSRDTSDPVRAAAALVSQAAPRNGRRLVRRHARAWEKHWDAADIQIEGDPEAERSLRFAAYHLISAANPEDELVSIGARTLSGEAYKGHVFWDTDTFILPFFCFTDPRSARAMLMYRWHTLDAAREKAKSMGYGGALFAWESADTGEETTPHAMLAPSGEVIPVVSGEQEHHISADVAYATWDYWSATGDDPFMLQHGAEIIFETARFWATRGKLEDDGRYHIRKVVGPDEYHEGVDDSAYTNVMAQWNMERGVELAGTLAERWPEEWKELRERLKLTDEEIARWGQLAAATYVGYDEKTGLIEQYSGFYGLEDYDLRPMRRSGKRGAPVDLLLGRRKTIRSKIVKQADVVMLMHLLWDRFPAHAREASFRYYEPRTAHGSSLSPASHALVAARLGEMGAAEQYFIQAARIDLANNMGNASGGVHAAALGGLWQAAVLGFAGMQLKRDCLYFDPHLPLRWQTMRFPVLYRGTKLRVEIKQAPFFVKIRVEGEGSARVRLEGLEVEEMRAGRDYVSVNGEGGWQPWGEKEPEGT